MARWPCGRGAGAITDAFISKLNRYAQLTFDDEAAVRGLLEEQPRTAEGREDMVREGERPRNIKLFLEGWACRYKLLEDGRRQLINFLLPGDVCDLHVYLLNRMDHSIATLTPVRYAEVSREQFEAVLAPRPRVMEALWRGTLVDAAVQREWAMNLGQRTALERVAHLFCELYYRLRAIGLVSNSGYELPLTQGDLADATGITSVHVNRTIQEMRARGLIEWKARILTIPSLRILEDTALFIPDYLHYHYRSDDV